MINRFLLSFALLLTGLAHADWAADRDASAGYVTVTTLATAVDEAVPFFVVYLSDLPADFHTAMTTAGDTDGKTIRLSTSDGATQLAIVPIGVNTGTDTGCLIGLGTGMSASVDVDYRIYVGNAALSMPTASGGMGEQAVFAAYAAVYFPGVDTRDWTAGGRTLTAVNSPGTAASGLEGITAATYNGSSSYHKYEGTQAVTNWPLTLETITYHASVSGYDQSAGYGVDGSGSNVFGIFVEPGGGTYYGVQGNGGSGSTPNTATSTVSVWSSIAMTRNANVGTTIGYLNGASSSDSTTVNSPTAFNRLAIGCTPPGAGYANFWDGNVAVALLSGSVRSEYYVSTMDTNWAGDLYSAGAWTPISDDCSSAATGLSLFGTATNQAGGTTAWTSPSEVTSDDGNPAYATSVPAGLTTQYLDVVDAVWGDDIPLDADTYTVSVRIKRARQSGGDREAVDETVQLIVGGTPTGSNYANTGTDWGSTPASRDYTGTWGLTLDGADFDSDFGVRFRGESYGSEAATLSVYAIWVDVEWTCGDTGGSTRGFFALTE